MPDLEPLSIAARRCSAGGVFAQTPFLLLIFNVSAPLLIPPPIFFVFTVKHKSAPNQDPLRAGREMGRHRGVPMLEGWREGETEARRMWRSDG